MKSVLFGLLRIVVGAVLSLVAFQLLFFLLARIAGGLGLTAPGGPELLLSFVVAVALAWVVVRRVRVLWPAPAAAEEAVDR